MIIKFFTVPKAVALALTLKRRQRKLLRANGFVCMCACVCVCVCVFVLPLRTIGAADGHYMQSHTLHSTFRHGARRSATSPQLGLVAAAAAATAAVTAAEWLSESEATQKAKANSLILRALVLGSLSRGAYSLAVAVAVVVCVRECACVLSAVSVYACVRR